MNLNSIFSLFTVFIIKLNVMVVGGDISNHSSECAIMLENFAAASARFMYCSLQNSRPVHICCKCIDEYNFVVDEHDNIIKAKKWHNSTCKEELVNQDRLEVIESGFSYITNLWSKAQCKNCIDGKNSLSNTTQKFISYYSDTSKCLEDNYNAQNKSYNPNVCFLCSAVYYNMSKFYLNLKETAGNGNVCMDIVDTVNVTQHLWSNVLHCGETVMTFELPLIASSVVVCILPIIFYLCAWKFTKDRPSVVLNQNRVSQRFRQRWRSRAGSAISN